MSDLISRAALLEAFKSDQNSEYYNLGEALELVINAPTIQQIEPFGYFKAEPFGWTDCAETDEGAIALYEATTVQREGWVSVPIEPTEKMIKQGDIAQWGAYSHCTHIYKAMIQAAPTDKE